VGRPRSFDEAEVRRRVRDAFWQRGFEATSIDDLTRATGLGKGSLYAAFGDKRRLFIEELEAYSAARLGARLAALHGEGPAIGRLRALFRPDAQPPAGLDLSHGCFLVRSTVELAADDPAVRNLARRTYGAIEEALVAVVAEAVAENDLPASTDARTLGRLLLAVMQGMEFLAKTGMPPKEVAEVGAATIAGLLGGAPARAGAKRGSKPKAR
jgi:TetR/AcrR family transcriptional repressor of nem operon